MPESQHHGRKHETLWLFGTTVSILPGGAKAFSRPWWACAGQLRAQYPPFRTISETVRMTLQAAGFFPMCADASQRVRLFSGLYHPPNVDRDPDALRDLAEFSLRYGVCRYSLLVRLESTASGRPHQLVARVAAPLAASTPRKSWYRNEVVSHLTVGRELNNAPRIWMRGASNPDISISIRIEFRLAGTRAVQPAVAPPGYSSRVTGIGCDPGGPYRALILTSLLTDTDGHSNTPPMMASRVCSSHPCKDEYVNHPYAMWLF